MYYAIHPEVLETERQRVAVITEGYARGLTLNIDAYNKSYMNPACDALDTTHTMLVGKNIDAKGFIDIFTAAFAE